MPAPVVAHCASIYCTPCAVLATGRVFAFEPEPTTFNALSQSVRRNHLENVTCVHAALSDRVGTALFHRAADGTASSLVAEPGRHASRYVEDVTVSVSTLDAYMEQNGLDAIRIGLIKVDVEGEETRTVSGMQGTLAVARSPIWCEVRGPLGSTRTPDTCAAVAAALAPLGYLPHRWASGAIPVRVDEVRGCEDVLFLASTS